MKRFLVLTMLFPALSMAQMDGASRDLLIDKLAKVNSGLAPADPSKVAVTLRLADLLADRARVNAMQDLDVSCKPCVADRAQAARLYQGVLDRVPQANRGKVMIQLGHLHQLNNEDVQARSFYEKVAKESSEPNVVAEARLSVAEILFKKNQFAEARKVYEEVLKVPTASSRGLAAYRAAWCAYHTGDNAGAVNELIVILQTPALLTKTGTASNQVDVQFQEEVSRDLATFLSKRPIESVDVQRLFDLSPASTKLSNVTLLAAEAERVGRKKEALMVWNFVYERQSSPSERLQVLLHRAPLLLDTGDREASLKDLQAISDLWKELKGCGQSDCDESKKLFRQFVVVWNQSEKTKPTAELSKAYGFYLEAFPADVEMNLWGAEVASFRKDYVTATARHEQAVATLRNEKDKNKLENVLLGNIELAEASSDDALLLRAQNLYLTETPTGTKRYEVQYQKARRLYDQNQHVAAADALKILAMDAKGPKPLRKQAADLSLDALGSLKDNDKLISWAKEFAGAFPESAGDYNQVGQKAVLTKSALLAATSSAAALAALSDFDAKTASPEDRILFLKNKLILAEKTGQFALARNAADELLLMKDLKTEDREFALGRKAWLAELQLDFASAFSATSQMALKDQAPEQKTLKLALYADLSGQNPVPLYQQYLKTTKDEEARRAVASEIVRRSKDPGKEIESQKPILEKSPELLARLYTEVYSKTSSDQILKKASSDVKLQKTNWGRLLTRTSTLKEFNTLKSRLASMQIDSKNQKTLARSIKDRAAELTRLEKMAAGAIQSGDWTSQLVTIDLVARESDRFYQELMGLPMPEGLQPEEEQEYMQLLSQQASPFKMKAEQAQAKVKEFWANPNWKSDLQKSVNEGAEFRAMIAQELAALKSAALPEDQAFFAGLEANNTQASLGMPDLKEIESAREKVRQNPMDRASAEQLLGLEKKSRNFAMVQYLEGRLRALPEKPEVVQ